MEPEELQAYRVTAVGANASGELDFEFFRVVCRSEQYDNGDHYEAVRAATTLTGTLVVFDDHDPAWAWVREHCIEELRYLDISANKLLS